VNAGAIAATSLVPGDSGAAKWRLLCDGLSRFAGRDLALSEEVITRQIAASKGVLVAAPLAKLGAGS